MKEVEQWAKRMTEAMGQVILGKERVMEKLLTTLLCGGHLLLEDNPGVGKTILARALAASLGGKFMRIQCTPDLLPSDILGVSVYVPALKKFKFHAGPIMTHVLLTDEINRATPRSQSALLEAMESGEITLEGRTASLPDPFFLIATENPMEFEGTFPLPEAQKDRFFMTLSMGYPPEEAELALMGKQKGLSHPVESLKAVSSVEELKKIKAMVNQYPLTKEIEDKILQLVQLTRSDSRLELGASPRASSALYKGIQALHLIRGEQADPYDLLKELALPVLQKRIKLRTEALLNGLREEHIIHSILEQMERENSS
ncbi:MAG: MoxR family ATPase [Spirochaetaceae bacterium]|nr:MoxR family ATPase [Spirochaetaceae bacterium]